MSGVSDTEVGERNYSGIFLGLLAFALLGALGGLIWNFIISGRLVKTESDLKQTQQQNAQLAQQLQETNAKMKVFAESAGLTQKQLQRQADELLRRQQADAKRLESQQQEASEKAQQQISTVSSDVSSVKTDVGGVKTDVAQTKNDLQSAVNQLQSMKGDMGVQSGLIATNHNELEILKHKGDRNYYEFTLHKGHREAVSTVGLELHKADMKHSRYTMNVFADDKKIEKKDRGLNEPVQFYTGKDNYLYELVVNNISKDTVQGYVSTPKAAPVPVTPSH